jgi:hypothetical protein
MEGTGMYWKPMYYVLEADFDLLGLSGRKMLAALVAGTTD